MIGYRELVAGLRALDLPAQSPVIAHIDATRLGQVIGGSETIVGALTSTLDTVIVPTFTTRAMVIPEVGPGDNAIEYGDSQQNKLAEIYHPNLPADPSMGRVAERLRRHPEATRSRHPLLSMAGVNAARYLDLQTVDNPWAPVEALANSAGYVLIAGASHQSNCAIHHAEMLAGRRHFIRWGITRQGVVECPVWPGCSDGFGAIAPRLAGVARTLALGDSGMMSIPLRDLLHAVVSWIREDPRALLCDRSGCPRCSAVRASVRVQ